MPDVNVAVIYYSATGSVYRLAQAAVLGAEKAGAQVRLRRVHELAPEEAIASNQGWSRHRLESQAVQEAELDDLDWADVLLFGTPTRFGMVAAQLKQFLDQAGPLWAQGRLSNKVMAGFVSVGTAHGGHESTLLSLFNAGIHWGCILVPPGYVDPLQFQTGNPYGASHTSANGANPPSQLELDAAESMARRATEVGAAVRQGLMRPQPVA